MDFLIINGLIKPAELHESFKDFDRLGGRARAIAMDRFSRGAISANDGIVRTEVGNGFTDHILAKPIELFSGTERSMKVQSIRVYKDGTIAVDYIAAYKRLTSDPIEHHWSGLEVHPGKESEFSKDFKKVAGKQVGDLTGKKIGLFVDYLKQLETQEQEIRAEGKSVKIYDLLSKLTPEVGVSTDPRLDKAAEIAAREAVERETVERVARQTETVKPARTLTDGSNLDRIFATGLEVVGADGKVVTVKGIRRPLIGAGEVIYLVEAKAAKNGVAPDAELTKTVKERLAKNETLSEALKDPAKAVEVLSRYAQASQDVRSSFGSDVSGQLVDYRQIAKTAQTALGPAATLNGSTVRFKSEFGISMVVKFKPEEGKKADVRSWDQSAVTNEKMAKLLDGLTNLEPVQKADLENAMKEYLKGNPLAKDFESCKTELAKLIRAGQAGGISSELAEVFKHFGVEYEGGKPKFENGHLVLRPRQKKASRRPTQGRAGRLKSARVSSFRS